MPAPPVTIIDPDVVLVDAAFAVNVADPPAVIEVNAPVLGFDAPILILVMPPSVSELIFKVPPAPIVTLPPGSIVTEELEPVGLMLTV